MFKDQINAFSENLDHLRDFTETVSTFLTERKNNELKNNVTGLAPLILAIHQVSPEDFPMTEEERIKVQKHLASTVKIELTDNESGEQIVKIGGITKDKSKNIDDAIKSLKQSEQRQNALYSNTLISLISTVEWFLAQLIHQYYKSNPHTIGAKEKQFSFEDLGKFETIEDARNYIIEKTVESVLRGSMEDWFEFFKSKFNLSMGYLDGYKKHLIEAAQRRNLLVHNGGVVNRIYLANYSKELGSSPKIGEKLAVDSLYINETISLFERCFILIAAELWKKTNKDDESRGDLMITLGFDHLEAERYDIAESLSYFAFSDKTLQEKDRLYAKINYWIAKKYSGQFDTIKKEIEHEDFSAKSQLFVLAKNILLDKYDDAMIDIEYLLTHDKNFHFAFLETWPLFRNFRETELYKAMLAKKVAKTEKATKTVETRKATKTAETRKATKTAETRKTTKTAETRKTTKTAETRKTTKTAETRK